MASLLPIVGDAALLPSICPLGHSADGGSAPPLAATATAAPAAACGDERGVSAVPIP